MLGNYVVDVIARPLERLPEPGRLMLIENMETHVGGNGSNTAGALGLLGARVAAVGRVGADFYGRFLTDSLLGWGVRTESLIRDAVRATSVAIVAVDGAGERSFLHYTGANAAFGAADLNWDHFPQARHLHLGSYFVLPALDGEPAAEVLREARRRGMTTSLDVCWDHGERWMDLLAPCLPYVDYFLPSEEEAIRITGENQPAEICRALLARGCGAVVLKLGPRGSYYSDGHANYSTPAYRAEVRDTTGAGDCFIAGFLHARLRSESLPEALRFGSACGARAVQAVGALTGLGLDSEIRAWAARQPVRGA